MTEAGTPLLLPSSLQLVSSLYSDSVPPLNTLLPEKSHMLSHAKTHAHPSHLETTFLSNEHSEHIRQAIAIREAA